MRTLMKKELKLQPSYQSMEILLAHDFEKMSLIQLNEVNDAYIALTKQNDKTLHWSSEQYKAWQFMHYCIKKLEHKGDRAKVGDVFHSSWGYEQTNTEYYKIVEISKTGKTGKVVQVGSISIGDKEKNARNMCESIVPDPMNVIDVRKQKVRIERSYSEHPYTKKAVGIGGIQLRGSVFIGTDKDSSKHLTTLFKVTGQNYRSWYA